MRVFFSTCPSGFEEAAARVASEFIPGFSVKGLYSGAVLFTAKTEKPECPGFTNTYLQIARIDKCSSVRHAAKLFLSGRKAFADAQKTIRDYGYSSYRVMFSDANKLIPVEPELRISFERAIQVRTDREHPDTEVLILRRSDGSAAMLLRLSRPYKAEKGELSRAIASCLVKLSKPEDGGLFIDPFAGHGALGASRMSMKKSARVFLSDIDKKSVDFMRKRIPSKAEIEKCDAFKLYDRFEKGSFTEIATDPPWGVFTPIDKDEYAYCYDMVRLFAYLLKPYGMCTVLTAQKDAFLRAVNNSQLKLTERYDVLVNGKKAAVFVMKRLPDDENA